MYDSIEDIPETPDERARRSGRLRVVIAVIICAGLLAGAAILAGRDQPPQDLGKAVAAEKAAYQAAITDPSAALRRARLTDFLKIYPKSQRITAVKAQLQVIAQAEARDWAALSHVLFDTERTPEDKLAALDAYETIWDTSLLGGRADEVTRFRKDLSMEDRDLPNRDLPIEPDASFNGAPGDALAGGVQRSERVFARPRPPVFDAPSPAQTDVVEPPRIRKNRRPKYPRRALERGAEAEVALELYIDANGRVDMIEVVSVKADAYEKQFIRAAERAALRTRFHPQTVNGIPVAVQGVEKVYRFEVRN